MSQTASTIESSQSAFEDAQLPTGWQWARLGDLCDFVRGVSFDKGEVKMSPTMGHIPILRAGNIGKKLDTVNDLIWIPSQNVSQEQRFREKDIAVCMSSGSPSVVGKTAQLEEPFEGSVGAFCGIIRAHSVKHANYLAYWLRSPSYEGWRDSQTRGANIQNLRFSEFASILLPLPPPSELNRITAILNEQMAAVELARAAAEAQLKAAKDLPAAYLLSAFDSSEARQWAKKRIGDVALLIQNGIYKAAEHYGHGHPFLRMYNVQNNSWMLSLDRLALVNLEGKEEQTFALKRGDLLISRVNSFELVGKCAWVSPDAEGFVFENMLIRVQLDSSVNSLFVAQQMATAAVRKQVEAVAKRAIGQASINSADLRAIEIALPSLDVQGRMANELSARVAGAEQASKALQDQLNTINKLPAALLRQAFTGKL